MAAHHGSVQKEDRNIESVAASQEGIAVDIDYIDGWQWGRAAQGMKLGEHLVAQLAVVAMDDREAWYVRSAACRNHQESDPTNDAGRLVRSWL